jgi:hypothetical protein
MKVYFSNFANYCMANKGMIFIFLVIFHASNTLLFDFIVQSDYFVSLHDRKPGFWNFAQDSYLYQSEAIILLRHLENSQWMDWFLSYSVHLHLKIVSLVYWITGISTPVVYEVIVLPFVWASSILLIYQSSHLLFPQSNKVPLLSSLYFFQPSVFMHSTQLLRDPYFTLGFSLLIYGMIVFYKKNSSFSGVININIGILLMLSMRSYISALVLLLLVIYALIFIYQKRASYLHLFVLILPLLVFQNFNVNKYLSIDKFNEKLNPNFSQMPDLEKFEERVGDEAKEHDLVFENLLAQKLVTLTNSHNGDINLEDVLVAFEKKERQDYENRKVVYKAVNYKYIEEFDTEKFEKKKNYSGFFTRMREDPGSPAILVSGINILDNIATQVSGLRLGFHNYGRNIQGGSYVDINQDYLNFDSLISYFPNALKFGLLSPFPTSIFNSGDATGRIAHILAGIETIIFYLLLLGSSYMILRARTQIAPISTIFLFSLILIVLLGYVVPNLGALYRLRQPYLIPFYLAGVQGLYLMLKYSNNKLNQT